MRAARSLPDGDDLTAKILAALEHRSPLSPAELVKATKGEKLQIRRRVQALERDGRVTCTGVTMSRQVHLGQAPATEPRTVKPRGPKPRARSSEPAPSGSPLDQIEARDYAVLTILQGAGRSGRSLRELAILRPEESEAALSMALTRLKVKKKIYEEDGKWRAA